MTQPEKRGGDIPTPFSWIKFWALVFAADIAAGDGPAKEPNRRVKREVILGEFDGLPWWLRVKRFSYNSV